MTCTHLTSRAPNLQRHNGRHLLPSSPEPADVVHHRQPAAAGPTAQFSAAYLVVRPVSKFSWAGFFFSLGARSDAEMSLLVADGTHTSLLANGLGTRSAAVRCCLRCARPGLCGNVAAQLIELPSVPAFALSVSNLSPPKYFVWSAERSADGRIRGSGPLRRHEVSKLAGRIRSGSLAASIS